MASSSRQFTQSSSVKPTSVLTEDFEPASEALSPAVPVASEVEQRRALLSEKRANDESERHHKTRWRSKLHSVASTITFVIGHGNVIHFPYLCAKHGGAAFLIPYTLANICVGVPLLYAEMSMGQFASVAPHKLFTRIGPAFIGVAASMAAVLVYRSFYFSAIMAQSFYVGVLALIGIASKMPWTTCDWTNNDCGTCDRFKETFECESRSDLNERANESLGLRRYHIESPYQSSYVMSTVQEIGYTAEDFKAPDPYIVLALLGIWLAAAALCYFGIRRLSIVFHVLKAIGVVVAVAVFGVAAYDGSKTKYFNGMKLFFTAADWKGLMHMQPWSDAIAHVLFSLSLGDGTILKIASHNQFNNNVLYDAMFATVADFVISVVGGVSFFASMGAVTERLYSQSGGLVGSTKLTPAVEGQMLHSKMEVLLLHGQPLVLSSFPDQMSSKTWGAAPTAAHYFNVVKLGLPSLVIFLSVTLRIVSDGSTRLFRWRFWRNWKCRRAICLALLTILSVGCSVVLVSPSGVLLARLFDKYTGIALLFIAFSEVVAIIHCYGFKRYISNIYTMLGMPLAAWQVHTFAGLYYFVTPAFLIIALVLQFVFHKPTVVHLYIFPGYFDGFGWFIAATCMVLIPIGWLRKLIPTAVCKLPTTDLYEPTGNWGPIARKNREVSRHNERAFRAKH